MKFIVHTIVFTLALFSFACNNDAPQNQVDLGPAPAPIDPSALQNTPATAGAAATSVNHYICPNNCAGSGGAQKANCPVCGTEYIHNQAYHNQQTLPNNLQNNPLAQQPQTQTPPTATNAAGVYHYTCPNGCAGGAAQSGTCATCGSQLAHNQAYHNQPAASANTNPFAQQPQQNTNPAQNSAGQFHYTCPNGCAGGAGNAGTCASCGAQLAHNQAYHNAPAGSATPTPGGGQKSPLYINKN